MKILLDTSYLLPLISIKIKELHINNLLSLIREENFQLFYSSISIFELGAKGASMIAKGKKLTKEDITVGINSLKYNYALKQIIWSNNPLILETAIEIRKIHTDFIDCLILATAIYNVDIFCTFDDSLLSNIKQQHEIREQILEINPDFSFWMKTLEKDPIKLSTDIIKSNHRN